jgi:predicted amidohydrolase YtcJ
MNEMMLINGRVYTQDDLNPWAEAILIRSGRIIATGSTDQLLSSRGSQTQLIDLQGQLVLPGLTDAHFHFHDWSLSRRELALAGVKSVHELGQRLTIAAQSAPSGTWIMGQGWNETTWADQSLPNRTDLDTAAPNHPAILWRSDLHLAVANSIALRLSGLTAATPNPPDGVIDRDASGQPTGVLRELAINLVSQIIPTPTESGTVQAMREALPVLHRLGLTGLHDFRIMGGAEASRAFRAYQHLHKQGQLALRLWMNIPLEHLDQAITLGLRTGFGDDFLQIGHVKLFSDGSQGARTAWMLEPYLDTGQAGMPLTPMAEIAEAVHRADQAGLAVAIHAIGDRANRELINVFEEVLSGSRSKSGARPAAPHRIEHVQNIRPDDLARLARLGIVASVQPIHATDDMNMLEQSVGSRSRYCYVFNDMLSAGITLALGSDCPVADPNPFLGIHAAVTRQDRNAQPPAGWYPQQRLSVKQAVYGYTLGPAIVTGRSHLQGSLSPGKFADLVVLDRDIFSIDPAEIADTKVILTLLDGRIVHQV